VTPRGRYEAVGKEGKLAAIISGVVAAVVIIGVIIALIVMSGSDDEDKTPAPAKAVQQAAPAETPAATADKATLVASRDCSGCPLMVTLPAGVFSMGISSDEAQLDSVPYNQLQTELPVHGVTIKQVFALGQTEVTRGQFDTFVKETGYQATGCVVHRNGLWVMDLSKSWRDPGFEQEDDHPVVCVNYEDAAAYAEWLARRTDKRYRLPTETEWEYAARFGAEQPLPWGDKAALSCAHGNVADRSHAAVYAGKGQTVVFPCDTGYAFTAPVAHFQVGPAGLYDMFGNARELVADCWNPNYWGKGLGSDARTTGSCSSAVWRGGGWADAPTNVRPARRFHDERTQRRADQGFRIAKDIPITSPGS
jgi:formylglycine-generating enzyme required for sulfatase activity